MSILINLLVYLLIFGIVYWVITLLPLPPVVRTIALVVFAIMVIVVLFNFVGGGTLGLPAIR